jgi:fucose permease
MEANEITVAAPKGLRRDALTWYSYLTLGFFTYLNGVQGNILPFLKQEFALSYGVVSLHPSAVAVGSLLVGVIGEPVVARLGRRRMLAVALVGGSLGIALLSLAHAAWQSIGACLLMGCTGAFIPAITSALLAEVHGPRRDIAYAEANALCYVFAIASPVLAWLAVSMGLSWRFVPAAGAAMGLAMLAAFARTPVPEGERAAATAPPPRKLPAAFWAYWLMQCFGVATEFSALLWGPTYFGQVMHLPSSLAALAGGAFFVGMLVGRTASIRLLRLFSLRDLTFGAIITALIGFVAYWATPMAAIAVVGLFVIGLGVAMLFSLALGFAMSAAGGGMRPAARMVIAPGLAVLLNPPLLGGIADHAGLWLAQLMIPVFLTLVAASFIAGQRLTRPMG